MQGTRSSSSSVFLSVIEIEVAETATSFWLVWTLGDIVTLLMAGVAIDMAQVLWRLVFLCYLGSIDPSSWMASLTTTLIFIGGLCLRLVSRSGGAVGLSLIFVFGGFILELPVGVFFVLFR